MIINVNVVEQLIVRKKHTFGGMVRSLRDGALSAVWCAQCGVMGSVRQVEQKYILSSLRSALCIYHGLNRDILSDVH